MVLNAIYFLCVPPSFAIFLGNRTQHLKNPTKTLTMPPSRRSKKVGLKRIDAALDALRPMGFSDPLIRTTVRTLLKAYGGDEGWSFIEEASYKLLIESILEGLESCECETSEPKGIENCTSKDDIMEDEPGVQVPSMPAPSMQVESLGICSPCYLNGDSVPEKLALLVHSPQNDSAPNHSLDIDSLALVNIIPPLEEETSPQISFADVHSPRMYSPPPMDSLPVLRRKPCYGWISSDDEEDLVYFNTSQVK